MTETQERFLKEVAARIPVERVAEVHLFQSLRQGAVESGVAVLAVDPDRRVEAATGRDVADTASGIVPGASTGAALTATADESLPGEWSDPTEAAAGAVPMAEDDSVAELALADDALPPTDPGEARLAARRAAVSTRLTVYTAHYRLAIKGPDRGKWVMSVAAEADAPLVTVEAVVRGVRHRTGDGHDSERLSGDEFRAAVAAPAGTAWIAAK